MQITGDLDRRALCGWLVSGASAPLSASAQWPQWRGPGGLGISTEKDLPTEWSPAAADKPAVNIGWKTEIPGRGHSSPIVAGNLVFVTTSIKGEEVPGRKAQEHLKFDYTPGYIHPDAVDIEFKHQLIVFAVDAATGKVAWQRTAYDGVMFDDRHRKNTFASSTMVTDGERVYASFESAGLYAYDLKGNLVWKKDLGGIIKAGLGPGTSPIIYKNLIILQCDQEMGTGSYIVALDKKTGDEVWRAEPDDAPELGDAAGHQHGRRATSSWRRGAKWSSRTTRRPARSSGGRTARRAIRSPAR